MMRLTILLCICFLLLPGCHSGSGTQKIYKYDGSVQCNLASGTPLAEMALELTDAGIDVVCAQKSHDGQAYIAACGAGTGAINVYTIHTANLKDAEALGFKSVLTLPDYKDAACM